MNILLAPDKFRGSLSAVEVARAIGDGVRRAGASCVELPMADGGDGSVDAALSTGWTRFDVEVPDALRRLHLAPIAFDGQTALVEVANTCGLQTLHGQTAGMQASSAGVGHALRAALNHDPQQVVLAAGGSASTDGGMGMLAALGATFEDEQGQLLAASGESLLHLRRVDLDGLIDLSGVELTLARDVTNPLFGEDGAAITFAPQKGATAGQVDELDRGLRQLVACLVKAGRRDAADLAEQPGAGSSGGVGFAALLLGAASAPGAEYFLDLLKFDAALAGIDLVVTGEGSLDQQTMHGKLVAVVARRASSVPVVAVVGRTQLSRAEEQGLGLSAVYAVSDRSTTDTSTHPDLTRQWLADIGASIVTERA